MFVLPVISEKKTCFSYFYTDEKSGHGFLINPEFEIEKYQKIIQKNNYTIEKIIFTYNVDAETTIFTDFIKALNTKYYLYSGFLTSKKFSSDLIVQEKDFFKFDSGNYFHMCDEITIRTRPDVILSVLSLKNPENIILYDKHNKNLFCYDNKLENENLSKLLSEIGNINIYSKFGKQNILIEDKNEKSESL